jgi:hypothetical protein
MTSRQSSWGQPTARPQILYDHSQQTRPTAYTRLVSYWPAIGCFSIDYRCDNGRFWLPAHGYQVPIPSSQNLEIEKQNSDFWS